MKYFKTLIFLLIGVFFITLFTNIYVYATDNYSDLTNKTIPPLVIEIPRQDVPEPSTLPIN